MLTDAIAAAAQQRNLVKTVRCLHLAQPYHFLILFTPTSHKSLTLFLPTIIIIMPPLSTEELLNSCSFFWQTKHRVMRRRIECDLGRRHATPRQTNQAFSRAAEKVEVVTKPWEMIWNITLPLAANTEYYYSELPLTAAAGLLYTKYVPLLH